MKVALYTRVSTEEQALNGISLDAQLNELREYAKAHHYSIVGEYCDEGISGGVLERPALTHLLDDIRDNKIELVLFVKLDRWFRSVAHYYKIQEILEQHNVNWLATQEDYETLTSSGKFKVNIMLSVSQQFKDATSERIKSVFDYKVKVTKEVISGSKVYGYDIVNKHYVINFDEAKNIVELFNKYIELGSINATAKWWQSNIKNELTNTIRDRLLNIKYNGKYEYDGIIYDDYIPQIIDDDTFNKVQSLLKMNYKIYPNKANKNRIYLLSGVIICAECGVRFTGYPYYSGNKAYHCSRKERHRCHNNKYIREDKVIDYILNNLEHKIEEYNLSIKENELEIDNSKTIKNLQAKYDRIIDAYINGYITIKDNAYKQADKIKKEIELLKTQQKKAKKKLNSDDYINLLNVYNELDDKHKQMFFRNTIERIEVLNGEIINFQIRTK